MVKPLLFLSLETILSTGPSALLHSALVQQVHLSIRLPHLWLLREVQEPFLEQMKLWVLQLLGPTVLQLMPTTILVMQSYVLTGATRSTSRTSHKVPIPRVSH